MEALKGYPLHVSIANTEIARSPLRFRHTNFVIQIDDCGKIYERLRRYTNFVWLHGELRRRELCCALPELPPKRAVGNMDGAFVSQRREMLEKYIKALVREPAILQDDALWAFLDADLATAVVPRFLVRKREQSAVNECLQNLLHVVSKEANLFRLCNSSVFAEFVSFVKEETDAETQVPTVGANQRTGNVHQALLQRLSNRERLCRILLPLIKHERARTGLIEQGMFGALMAMLCRTTEEMEAADDATKENYDKIKNAAKTCLQELLEGSKGQALLHFCQQENGLTTLRRLTKGPESLHAICASLLWHGLQERGVVTALVGQVSEGGDGGTRLRPGLTLLGSLIRSVDVRARVLAALCLATVCRHEGALDDEDRMFCMEEIEKIPDQLDSEENAAIERTAHSVLDRSTILVESSIDHAEMAGTLRTQSIEAPTVQRDQSLSDLLKKLCCRADLPRLLALLSDSTADSNIDSVTGLIVVILDHFVQHFVEEPATLRELSGVAQHLQRLVEGEDESWTMEGVQAFGEYQADKRTSMFTVRIRAARTLIRLDWPKTSEASGEPPPLATFGHRARILEVLTRYSAICQEKAQRQLAVAQNQGHNQCAIVERGGLTEALCVDEARLGEFSREVTSLVERRSALEQEVLTSTQAIDAMLANLERRGIMRGVLKDKVDSLNSDIVESSAMGTRNLETQEEVRRCEAASHEASLQVQSTEIQKKRAEEFVVEKEMHQRDAESRYAELQRRETDLAEVCNNAPALLQQVQAQLEKCRQRRSTISMEAHRLASEAELGERQAITLRSRLEEAQAAVRSLKLLQGELVAFKTNLNSETILTDAEVDRLHEFDLKLQPHRPARLRQAAGESHRDLIAGVNETTTPSWESIHATEQAFREQPHYRSFRDLCSERERLWAAELAWAQEQLRLSEATMRERERKKTASEQDEREVGQEEVRLQNEENTTADFQGHAARYDEARDATTEASEAMQNAAADVAEARGDLQLIGERLELAQNEMKEANDDLARAREIAQAELARARQKCVDLEAFTADLEDRTRNYLQEWRTVELEEHRLALLQSRVTNQLQIESEGRMALRAEAQRLIEQLHELDRQLEERASSESIDAEAQDFAFN